MEYMQPIVRPRRFDGRLSPNVPGVTRMGRRGTIQGLRIRSARRTSRSIFLRRCRMRWHEALFLIFALLCYAWVSDQDYRDRVAHRAVVVARR